MINLHKKNNYSFKKKEKIRNKTDFNKIFTIGRRFNNKYFSIITCKNELNYRRIAVIVGKKYGDAHFRNKIKRRIREIYRLNKEKFISCCDYIIIPRNDVKRLDFLKIKDSIFSLLEKYK